MLQDSTLPRVVLQMLAQLSLQFGFGSRQTESLNGFGRFYVCPSPYVPGFSSFLFTRVDMASTCFALTGIHAENTCALTQTERLDERHNGRNIYSHLTVFTRRNFSPCCVGVPAQVCTHASADVHVALDTSPIPAQTINTWNLLRQKFPPQRIAAFIFAATVFFLPPMIGKRRNIFQSEIQQEETPQEMKKRRKLCVVECSY